MVQLGQYSASLNTARSYIGGATGAQTASLAFGGYYTYNLTLTESYNGTSWTSVNNLPQD
jgi:hypothetical protein